VERVLVLKVLAVVCDEAFDVVFERAVGWLMEESLRDAASWLKDGEFVCEFHDGCTPVGGEREPKPPYLVDLEGDCLDAPAMKIVIVVNGGDVSLVMPCECDVELLFSLVEIVGWCRPVVDV